MLLGLRAGLEIANAGVGIVSGLRDFQDGLIELEKAYAGLKLSREQQDIFETYGVTSAKLQFIISAISLGTSAFDINDARKALKVFQETGDAVPLAEGDGEGFLYNFLMQLESFVPEEQKKDIISQW